jgi:hypothetical protein
MGEAQKYLTLGLCFLVVAMLLLGMYAKMWEWQQPKQQVLHAKVLSIKPYSSDNDLHWTSKGFRIQLEGEERVVDFPLKYWDKTVREGDSVTMTVRKSFPLFGNELDGLSIKVIDD